MAAENWHQPFSYPAAADFSAVRHRFVTVNTSGLLALCGAGALPDGIMDQQEAAGAMIRTFSFHGIVKKILLGTGGATLGALLSSDGNGKGVISVTEGHIRCAKALEAGAAGVIIRVLYQPYAPVPAP